MDGRWRVLDRLTCRVRPEPPHEAGLDPHALADLLNALHGLSRRFPALVRPSDAATA